MTDLSPLQRQLIAYSARLLFLDGIPPIVAAPRTTYDIDPHANGDTLCGGIPSVGAGL